MGGIQEGGEVKQSPTFDAIDRKILRILQCDATLSHAALAERAGTSAASCWRRVHALEQAGVLGATVRLLDPVAIGQALDVVCQVRMKSHDLDAREDFERFVAGYEEVMECFAMSGEWDYQLRIVTSDVGAYQEFLMRHLLCHPAVATSASHFALKRIKYTTAMPI